jgi:phosphatidylserine synthase
MALFPGVPILALLLLLAVALPWPIGALIAVGLGAVVVMSMACGLAIIRADWVQRIRVPDQEAIDIRMPRLVVAAGVAAGVLAIFGVILTAVLALAT